MSKSKTDLNIVGVSEIADMLGVARQTVRQWRVRGVLPEPEATVSGVPVWQRETIRKWHEERKALDKPKAPLAGP